MAFCESCGIALAPQARFCGSCGKPVAQAQTQCPEPNHSPVASSAGAAWTSVSAPSPSAPAPSPTAGWSEVSAPSVSSGDSPAQSEWKSVPATPPPSPASAPNPGVASGLAWSRVDSPPPGQNSTPDPAWTQVNASSAATAQTPPPNPGWTQVNTPPPAQAAGSPGPAWTPVNAGPAGIPAQPAPPYNAQPAASSGLTSSQAAAFSYLLGPITGVLFLMLDPYKQDRFVRFHAMQSIVYSVACIVFSIAWNIVVGILIHMVGWIALVTFPIRLLISLGMFLLWLYCMYQAYSQRQFSIPVIGSIAAQQAK